MEQIDGLCQDVDHQDHQIRHAAAFGLRKIFSADASEGYIQRIIDNGVISKLLNNMKNRKYPQLQYESCWIITNIACGSKAQCESIVAKDGLDAIFQQLY